jgi:hypothetical protein
MNKEIPGKLNESLEDYIPVPKQSVFKPTRKKTIESLRSSLSTPTIEKPANHQSHYSKIYGKFQIFRILHGSDVIFVMDDERCERLELQSVRLDGIRKNATVRLRSIGKVEGFIRSDAPVYQLDKACLGLRRVNGNAKIAKETSEMSILREAFS